MRTTPNRLTGGLVTILGVLALGTGVYFLGIRPTLLPEDIRFTGMDGTTLPQPFIDWLGIVFRTWGGFITGFGIVIIGIGFATFAGDNKMAALRDSRGYPRRLRTVRLQQRRHQRGLSDLHRVNVRRGADRRGPSALEVRAIVRVDRPVEPM